MFYFIRKKIVVDCFINMPFVAEKFPIQRGLKSAPGWWKSLAPMYETAQSAFGISRKTPTMRFCQGFTNLYQNSWVFPLWTDLLLKTHDTGAYQFLIPYKSPMDLIAQHSGEEHGHSFEDFIHLKLMSPWLFFEKKGIKFCYFGTDWSLLKQAPRIRVLPGIVEYQKNHSTNVNLFVPREDFSYEFSAGLPLCHIAPMTEHKVEFRTQCVTDIEYGEIVKRTAFGKTTFRVNS